MLHRVTISGFQSLKRVRLNLGKFTVILGVSDVGKSAVVRAISAAVSNQVGQAFITHGEKSAGIELAFDDGAVAWVKSESAEYKFQPDPSGPVATFSKSGRSVPLEISSFLRMGDIDVGDDVVQPNIQTQFSAPFLLTVSGSLRARLLGEVSGVNQIYLAVQEARRLEQAAKRLLTDATKRLDAQRQRLHSFSGLVVTKTSLAELTASLSLLTDDQLALSALSFAITELSSLHASQRSLSDREARLRVVETLDLTGLSSEQEWLVNARTALRQVQEARRQVTSLEGLIGGYGRLDSLDTSWLEQQKKYLETLTQDRDSLLNLQQQAAGLTERRSVVQSTLSDLLVQLREIKVCPTCQQPIEAESLLEHAHL